MNESSNSINAAPLTEKMISPSEEERVETESVGRPFQETGEENESNKGRERITGIG